MFVQDIFCNVFWTIILYLFIFFFIVFYCNTVYRLVLASRPFKLLQFLHKGVGRLYSSPLSYSIRSRPPRRVFSVRAWRTNDLFYFFSQKLYDCRRVQSAVALDLDRIRGHLYVLDSGYDNGCCQPKIVIYDLKTTRCVCIYLYLRYVNLFGKWVTLIWNIMYIL